MLDLIIKNGTVVSPEMSTQTDVGIKDGKVVMLGDAGDMPEATRVIDAQGKYVLPGGIDTHTHFNNPPFMGIESKADFYVGSKATAIGGTTTIIDFAIQGHYDTTLPMEVLERRIDLAQRSVIDFGFHSVITNPTAEAIKQMKEIINFGAPSFKCFMTYRKDGIMADDAALYESFLQTKEHGGIFGAHTENDALTVHNIEKALNEGHHEPIWHAKTKNSLIEAESINRALFFAESVGAAFYDFHMSCLEGVKMVKKARAKGQPIYAETTTHYLTVTDEKLKGSDGINYICSPPLRTREHVESLWTGINDGVVHTVGSDDCSFSTKQKTVGGTSFEKVPNGMPGAEFRMAMVFNEGVSKGRININKYVAITSTNAAKILGLYPKKGIIAVGSDADVVIIDPDLEKEITIKGSNLDGVDWTPFEGTKVLGWPIMTISKGKVIAEKGQFTGCRGTGEFLKRKLHPDINSKIIL